VYTFSTELVFLAKRRLLEDLFKVPLKLEAGEETTRWAFFFSYGPTEEFPYLPRSLFNLAIGPSSTPSTEIVSNFFSPFLELIKEALPLLIFFLVKGLLAACFYCYGILPTPCLMLYVKLPELLIILASDFLT
jgi:hypothetical protein